MRKALKKSRFLSVVPVLVGLCIMLVYGTSAVSADENHYFSPTGSPDDATTQFATEDSRVVCVITDIPSDWGSVSTFTLVWYDPDGNIVAAVPSGELVGHYQYSDGVLSAYVGYFDIAGMDREPGQHRVDCSYMACMDIYNPITDRWDTVPLGMRSYFTDYITIGSPAAPADGGAQGMAAWVYGAIGGGVAAGAGITTFILLWRRRRKEEPEA